MNTSPHVRDQLSAFLDGTLTPAERMAVDAHLGTCAECRARLAELRGVATLLRSLPDPSPSRRLVPRLAAVPAWMAPLRTLATLASGISVFLFMASAILANIGYLAQSGTTTASGAAAVAPQAAPAASAAVQDRAATAGPSSAANSTTPSAPQVGVATRAPDSAFAAQARERTTSGFLVGPSPWVWLLLAIVTGGIAYALQRRLRSS